MSTRIQTHTSYQRCYCRHEHMNTNTYIVPEALLSARAHEYKHIHCTRGATVSTSTRIQTHTPYQRRYCQHEHTNTNTYTVPEALLSARAHEYKHIHRTSGATVSMSTRIQTHTPYLRRYCQHEHTNTNTYTVPEALLSA